MFNREAINSVVYRMKKLKLFFSWQSDIKGNHDKIRESLIKACNTIKKEGEYDIEYSESTWDRSGSPVIEKVVMEKAKECDIFVADITPVVTTQKKSIPNPNVMLELGVAKTSLIDEEILLLFTNNIEADKMPFDINHQRMSRFSQSTITDYIRLTAETAAQNPKHTSIFDNNDKFLYYNRNVKKNISSGKYLPNVYIEDREIKQHLRDFVSPYSFCKLVLERCNMIDTYRTNRNRRFIHKEPFTFDVSKFKSIPSEEQLPNFYQRTRELKEYLNEKYNELHNNNADYLWASKYGRQVLHLKYILGKILLITTSAGQGKTNLICDLVDNVLLKRDIPFIFLNGYEINSGDICESFTKSMLPTAKISFDEAIRNLAIYCRYRRSPVILIIDGLNENPNPNMFSRNLEVFLEAVLQYDCVKVIMTCRTEYYAERFSSLDAVFVDRMIKIEDLNKHLHDEERERLLENYFEYFKITIQLSHHVKERLCEDFLLLRIFCESNHGKNLGPVYSINREELFTEYYERMTCNLIKKVREEENYQLSPYRVKTFIMRLAEYMIVNNQFFNVPLSYIEDKFDNDEKKIFMRFLDENILLRKDLTPGAKGLFGRNEVVNFTYDAFRDYLLSSYLSDHVFNNNRQQFFNCINDYTGKEHQLREGITPFLLVHNKNNKNIDANTFLSKLDWYEGVFEKYIWDVSDQVVTDEDIKLINKILRSDSPSYVTRRLIFYGRWSKTKFPKLNIGILLNYLSTLNDETLPLFIEKIWSDKVVKSWDNKEKKTERTLMIESLEQILEEEKICGNKDFHNLFELLLYIAICSKRYAFDVFIKYFMKYKNRDMLDKVFASSKCNMLIIKIEEIRRML